ncbi:hypothetical protein UPYG_G00259560 [Umbra pygmaea]|uniref:Muscarinic acetylcholine receptor n=1 Tax=Umbra pygmaea TaxID=75934 RepID=A0ABD0WW52_UMBPY
MDVTSYIAESESLDPSQFIGNIVPSGIDYNASCLHQYDNRSYGKYERPSCPYTTAELVLIIVVTGSLSFVTVLGNILVMLSIKLNRHLQTVNNYFLFSLACADLIIGLLSMNLYTLYIVKGYWPLGEVTCDLWLALDYVVSNASVMNLLIISFDRYFCVTQPLTYPARRTTRLAGLMIAGAWLLSLVLWAPVILFWQSLVGKRIVPDGECYIQLLSNPAVTLGLMVPAFYLPAAIMIVLYARISFASRGQFTAELKRRARPSSGRMKHRSVEKKSRVSAPRDLWRDSVISIEPETSIHPEQVVINCPTSKALKDSTDQANHSVISNLGDPPSLASEIHEFCSKDSSVLQSSQIVAVTNSPEHRPSEIIQDCLNNMVTINRRGNINRSATKFSQKSPILSHPETSQPGNKSSPLPNTVWTIGYWLCYINSTLNPACYALCNVTFRRTFKKLLRCHYKNIDVK